MNTRKSKHLLAATATMVLFVGLSGITAVKASHYDLNFNSHVRINQLAHGRNALHGGGMITARHNAIGNIQALHVQMARNVHQSSIVSVKPADLLPTEIVSSSSIGHHQIASHTVSYTSGAEIRKNVRCLQILSRRPQGGARAAIA